jgi:tetratricopeptide (TPR) repeat protein
MPDQAEAKSECPPSQVWDEIAAGLLPGEAAIDLLEHAAQCSKCAQLLRESLAIVAPEQTETPPDKPRWLQRSWLALAALLTLAVAPASWWWMTRPNPQQAARQLAEAYASGRMMEARWPDARHGPYSVSRSSGGTPSQELLAAQQAVQEGLSRHPDDRFWQLARCQLRILHGELSAAIEELERLRSLAADRKHVDETLALALFQRGEVDGRRSDYEAADRIWAERLSADPDDVTALFNAALTKQRLHERERAISLLERLIPLEQDPGWKQEAVRRLEELRGQLRGPGAPQ